MVDEKARATMFDRWHFLKCLEKFRMPSYKTPLHKTESFVVKCLSIAPTKTMVSTETYLSKSKSAGYILEQANLTGWSPAILILSESQTSKNKFLQMFGEIESFESLEKWYFSNLRGSRKRLTNFRAA